MSPLNDILPEVLVKKIEDMACRRIINSNRKSNELILVFELNRVAEEVHEQVMQWLFKCLDTISYKVRDCNQYEWNIISQIKDNSYQDDDDLINSPKNSIIVAIHITCVTTMSFNQDGITLPYNYGPKKALCLSPQEIMNCLIKEPMYIKQIGISSISSDVMMLWWEEMISIFPNCLDIAGEGYMKHPMWVKLSDEYVGNTSLFNNNWGNWVCVRESSYNFGWKGYTERMERIYSSTLQMNFGN
tara:strand:- start:4776 stop:5507 length:732 start_codon:yes stop_codon:yes gene_type:complete